MKPEMYYDRLLTSWTEEQKPKAAGLRNAPAFYRNLEVALDKRRAENALITAKPRYDESVADFSSSDFLSCNRSGAVREAFAEELAKHEKFMLSSSGSRTQFGNYDYLNEVEGEIAAFHGAETALLMHSGFIANMSVLSAVPLPGDAIVYDELVHASTHDGMALSLAAHKVPFRHNDVDSLRAVLQGLKEAHPALNSGARSLLICIESIYSMDGDVCPLREFVDIAKAEFPLGNAQFLIDEAHSTGVIGPNGAGLVSMLGMEDEIAVRLQMCSKATAAAGGIILCNKTIRTMLLNYGKFLIYSSAISFPMVASIRAGFKLLMSGATQEAQEKIQQLVKHFFRSLTANPIWEEAVDEGLLSIPLLEDWESRPFVTHIVPIRTRTRHEMFLYFQMLLANLNAYPISYPIVPKGQSRIRVTFHAHNTFEQVDTLVTTICTWAKEMLDIEQGEAGNTLPSAARQVYAYQAAVA